MSEAIHYEVLLIKYIQYLIDAEGADFIDHPDMRHCSDVRFTDAEWSRLGDISKFLDGSRS